MDWHPTEQDLVLHYYSEATTSTDPRVADHLRSCAACAADLHGLAGTLALVHTAPVPEPDSDLERRVWSGVQRRIQRRRESRPRLVTGALAAGLVAAVAVGYAWVRTEEPAPANGPERAATVEDVREGVLLTALGDHFSDTEVLLVELLHAPDTPDAGWEFQRRTADDLVASGRIYRQTARETGHERLADIIDDLEGVLVEVATAPATVDRRDVEFLRARIEDDALLFKVRAVATDIRGRQQLLTRQN